MQRFTTPFSPLWTRKTTRRCVDRGEEGRREGGIETKEGREGERKKKEEQGKKERIKLGRAERRNGDGKERQRRERKKETLR